MIAVDAFGGDFAPEAVLQGSINAARKGVPIALFGPTEIVHACLQSLYPQWRAFPITIYDCTQVISMADEPVAAVTHKRDSSLVRIMDAVGQGECSAAVSAGNSGAALVAACLFIKRLPAIVRPALSVLLPTRTGGRCLLLDVGANVDCKPAYLEQFAYMGAAAAQSILSISSPRVALLSNGAEASKGNALAKQTFELLDKSPLNFVGNIEGRYVFDGEVDVIVCDGFVGNVLLKTAQGAARFMQSSLKTIFTQSLWHRALGMINRPVLSQFKKRMDYTQYGGGLLLGVRKPVVIAHGSSQAYAIEQAIMQAHSLVQENVVEKLAAHINELITIVPEQPRTAEMR
jgi:glycerol-3-phosphate acyltransferase PlsX